MTHDTDTEIDDADGTAAARRGLEQVRGLGGGERKGDVGDGRRREDRARIGVEAARQVDREAERRGGGEPVP